MQALEEKQKHKEALKEYKETGALAKLVETKVAGTQYIQLAEKGTSVDVVALAEKGLTPT